MKNENSTVRRKSYSTTTPMADSNEAAASQDEQDAKKHVAIVDAVLKDVTAVQQVCVLRKKLLQTLASLDEITRQKDAQDETQMERNALFIGEIEKMQQFAMEGMAKAQLSKTSHDQQVELQAFVVLFCAACNTFSR